MTGILGQFLQLSDSSTLSYSITICSKSPKNLSPWLRCGDDTLAFGRPQHDPARLVPKRLGMPKPNSSIWFPMIPHSDSPWSFRVEGFSMIRPATKYQPTSLPAGFAGDLLRAVAVAVLVFDTSGVNASKTWSRQTGLTLLAGIGNKTKTYWSGLPSSNVQTCSLDY